MEFLFPTMQFDILNVAAPASSGNEELIENNSNTLFRLDKNWYKTPERLKETLPTYSSSKHNYNWKFEHHHHVGMIIHQTLQEISNQSVSKWDYTRIQQQYPIWTKQLLQYGVGKETIPHYIASISRAIEHTLKDERGRWLLEKHEHACSEYEITSIINGKIMHLIIDRTFVDTHGVRWIVDYKTAEYTEKAKYETQLNLYATAIQQLENRPIRLGIYFPMSSIWYEWEFLPNG